MQAWEVAKKRYPNLCKDELMFQTCPNLLDILDAPNPCYRTLCKMKNIFIETTNIQGGEMPKMCIACWEREVEE